MWHSQLFIVGAFLVPAMIIPAALRAWDIGRCLEEALDGAHMNRATAAGYLGISEPQLSRAIAGQGPEHLSADRLTRLPRPVLVRLWLAVGERIGLVADADTRAAAEARRLHRQVRAAVAHDNAGVSACGKSARARGGLLVG